MSKLNGKIILVMPLINILFPIISVEDIVPWISTAVFIYLSYKTINKGNISCKKVVVFTLFNGMIILIYNILVKIISDYLVKLLM